ncbi:spastin-like [Panicum miliaceum]|uniref:Spastin-like n=1 Tax=Panicum miliaceum TaxID=4540 RepID=A0A3L6PIH3_PANMI|nr:spastin-like [Panicum miliaceum]
MRLRCLLRSPPWRKPAANPAAASSGGGAALVRTLGAPTRPCGEKRRLCRFYSSKEGVGSAEAAAVGSGGGGGGVGGSGSSSSSSEKEHARLGERDQQEWLSGERFLIGCKRRESPFLTRRDRFRNEFLRRVVPWDKTGVSWNSFPYYVDQNARQLLCECVASHLRHKDVALEYGSGLQSSSGRILLQSLPGTELYRERFVRALANELRASLLVLDSSVLAPYDCGEDCSESEEEDNHAESEDEGSESEVDGEGDEESGQSDDDDSIKSVADLKKLVPCTLEEFAKRVVGLQESSSAAESSGTAESSEEEKRSLQKGDRVKYVGASVVVEADNRIILGKVPTQDGSKNAYTFISGRTLSNGQRGEVYEINGDQVAVIFDPPEEKVADGNKDEVDKVQNAKPAVYWVDTQDIEHDHDTQAEDWHIAIEALCEVLPSLQPAIVYFPDSSQWLSRAVPRSNRREFVEKVEEMFDQLTGPLVLICGQNIAEASTAAPKDKEPRTLLFHNLARLSPLSSSLKRLVGDLKERKPSRSSDLTKLFKNRLFIPLPKDDEQLRVFNNQIEEDKKIIISRHNLVELHKVLEEHELSCEDLLHVKSEGVALTKQRAEIVVGWARSHYLSSAVNPSIKGDRLIIPRESLDLAIGRLKEQEASNKKPSENMKMLAKDEYERNFISAVVPPNEIGVRFDDIGALEDVKKTLDELVTLPMRRPELFSHGNLLRPCKGILLFGPPGTGKTLLAKALATEAGANFISITGSTLTSKWFGDAEKLTKALFSFASRLAPVIIFVDEVDSLLGARGGAHEHEATRRMRNEFMAAWDGLRSKENQRILILGATNRPFDLDDAVIRRLPRRILVDMPDAKNRMKILKILLAKENLESDFRFDELANATEGYSGSDLKNLCIAAAYRPVHELLEQENKGDTGSTKTSLRALKLDDFVQAKAKVSPSVAFDATSMNELRKWNEQYGEGGSRSKSPFGFGS